MNLARAGTPARETVVVRVWLPDRPGALGQVASRIGALRGDVVGIDILERGGGQAVDELVVALPEPGLVELLVGEITQVDGVAVEDVRRVEPNRPDAGVHALHVGVAVVEAPASERIRRLCEALVELVDGHWAVALDTSDSEVGEIRPLVSVGDPPDTTWLRAFLAGSSHLSDEDQMAGAPGDLAWCSLVNHRMSIAVGRAGRPFHTRERQHVGLLGRLVDALPLGEC